MEENFPQGEDMIPQGSRLPIEGPAYETGDLGLRGILVFAAILTAVTVLTMLILGFWYAAMAQRESQMAQKQPPRFADEAGQFPEPRLQANPWIDMAIYKEREQAILDSYGWVDGESKTSARIPIERAITLTLDRINKPASASAPSAPATSNEAQPEPSPAQEPETAPPTESDSKVQEKPAS